ncbi:MAG TPA: serine/threonine protein kinase [Planctomycetaceae bacterium]|nr:serine/threonine protein kinase [Planctomycetaceae bacterium]
MQSQKTIEQVIAAYVTARERGEQPSRSQLLEDNPSLADELREFFQLHDQLSGNEKDAETQAGAIDTPGTPDKPASSHVQPPRELGDYEILEEIDRGGMGVVYKARHKELGRVVALKLIRSGELASEEEIQRFRSEAEAAAALTHPGIVPIYEVGMLDGLVYYTMAYINGQSLAEMVDAGPLDPKEAARIVQKLCVAVEHAHQAGVFHRDIKPANVLVDKSGQPILIDFGLAKMAHQDNGLTTTGQLLGTPAYMAPEHASGRSTEVTPMSDVYSLGALLHFLCAGQPPFTGPTPFDVLLQVLDRAPVPPSKLNRRVSYELDYVCQRGLEKDPKDRYDNAAQMAGDLSRILAGKPVDCPTLSPWSRFESWWRREPILVVHLIGIGITTSIVAISQWVRGGVTDEFVLRIILLLTWILASFALQYGVVRERLRDAACLTWATVDVCIYTTLIAFAAPPRSMLLIGYPMMIVASSLFYRKRFLVYMTTVCIIGFLMLAWLAPLEDFVKYDFAAIFIAGLVVICFTLLSTIRRVRSMSVFYDDEV